MPIFDRRMSAGLPIAMSLSALALVAVRWLIVGRQPDLDEGLFAHVWQLLMAGQIPVVAMYGYQSTHSERRRRLSTFALHACAALLAVIPVALLGW